MLKIVVFNLKPRHLFLFALKSIKIDLDLQNPNPKYETNQQTTQLPFSGNFYY